MSRNFPYLSECPSGFKVHTVSSVTGPYDSRLRVTYGGSISHDCEGDAYRVRFFMPAEDVETDGRVTQERTFGPRLGGLDTARIYFDACVSMARRRLAGEMVSADGREYAPHEQRTIDRARGLDV